MNRRFLFILAVNLLCVSSLFGQSGKREVDTRFGYGIYPLTFDLFDDNFWGCAWHGGYLSVKDDYHNALEFAGDRVSSGSFNFGRYYKVLRWMDLGASVSYAGTYQTIYNSVNPRLTRRDDYHSLFLTPTIRFAWFNREYVRMYSSVGFGLGMMFSSDDSEKNEVGPSIQLTGLGISVGKRLYGFSEVQSVGTLGFITFGVGYRFNVSTYSKKQ
ncbi:MAG: hypothetical protein PHT25_06865 [Bacteroidales bacterium]|nr:hypothetical protein [Bacteroidales bacterium]